MAHISFTGFEELDTIMQKLAEPEKMAIKAVDEAAPILEKSLRSAVAAAANRGYATGELEGSIRATKAKENDMGVFSVVKPEGSDKTGLRNVEKMAYLEYGVASRGQAAHPVRQKAINDAQSACISAMERVISEEVEEM
jgi:hypothetical protein